MDPDPLSATTIIQGTYENDWVPPHLPPEVCPEGWVIDNPKVRTDAMDEQISWGAQVLFAPTGWSNRNQLGHYGCESFVETYNQRLVATTRACGNENTQIFGCIGGVSMTLRPFGNHRFEDFVAVYQEQAVVLAPIVDGFSLEGMTNMAELRGAVVAIRQVSDKPIWVTLTCDDQGRLEGGTDLLAALITLEGMGVSAFGLASGADPMEMVEQMERLAPYANIPLLARLLVDGGEELPPLDGEDMTRLVRRLSTLGVTIFGGWGDVNHEHMVGLHEGIATIDPLKREEFATDPDVIPCASESEARFITPDIEVGEPLECTPDLLEQIVWAEEESPQGAVKIAIYEWDDIDMLADTQYAIRDPLCIETDIPELLDGALAVFQGRAFWDSTVEIEEEFLKKMRKKYGLILL